jgi:hypothetical protein
MNTDNNLSNELKGTKPQYVALARQSPDSEYMVTVGSGWKVKGCDNIVLRLDLLPTKWDGTVLLARSKNNKFLAEIPSTKGH